jgi:hypothetical protein
MRGLLGAAMVVALVAACAHPAPPPAGTKVTTAAPDAGPARILYQRGKIYVPTGADDDRYTCVGSPDEEAACQQVRPGAACHLESPVGYWEGELYCRGTPVEDWEHQRDAEQLARLAVPRCECDCTDAFMAAYEAFERRRDDCSRIP